MEKICHIRCEKDYFFKKNYKKDFSSNEMFSSWEDEIDLFLSIWDREFRINYMEFRRLIRNITISYIKKSNNFDIIFEDNWAFHEYLNSVPQTKNIIVFQQDDDDIFLNIPFKKLQLGVNRFMFTRFSYNHFLKRGFLTKTLDKKANKLYLHSNNYVFKTQVDNLNYNNYGAINRLTKSEWYSSHTRFLDMVDDHKLPVTDYFNDIIAIHMCHISSISNIKKIFKKSTDINICKNHLRSLVESAKKNIIKLHKYMTIPIVPYGKEYPVDCCISFKNEPQEKAAFHEGFQCIEDIGKVYLQL